MKVPKFHNLHARVGHIWDTDKTDGSEVIVAEVDPHGFMGNLATRQEVAEFLASAPRLQKEHAKLRSAIHSILFQVLQGPVFERDACITEARTAYKESAPEVAP